MLDTLGQGGFGITYLAEHIPSGKKVVIKENMPAAYSYRDTTTLTVAPTGSGEEKDIFDWALERFLEEAQLLAELNHPHIVQVTEAFTALGTAYYVMDYIEGNVLHKSAPAPDKITEKWLSPVLCNILQALNYVHSCGLLHRDIKPNNILHAVDGRAVLIDFGTARSLVSERSATVLESPGYTPLEQMQTNGAKGPWVDIYALGATCYHLLTGTPPPRCLDRLGDNDGCRRLAQSPELCTRFSKKFLQGIDCALSLNYKQRWQTVDDWLNNIQSPALPAIPTNPVSLPQRRAALPTLPAARQSAATDTAGVSKKGAGRAEWWLYVAICSILIISINNCDGTVGGMFLLLLIIYLIGAWRRLIRLQLKIHWLPMWIIISFLAFCTVIGITDSRWLSKTVFFLFIFVIPGLIPDPAKD